MRMSQTSSFTRIFFIRNAIKFKINIPSLPETKDLDELEFRSSKKEKYNELAVKLLKLREHL